MRNRFLKRSLIRKRLRRTTAVCLALLLLLTQLVVVAAATEKKIIGISAVAQNVLIEDYDGSLIPWWDEEANEKEYFNYYVSNSMPLFTVTSESPANTPIGSKARISVRERSAESQIFLFMNGSSFNFLYFLHTVPL